VDTSVLLCAARPVDYRSRVPGDLEADQWTTCPLPALPVSWTSLRTGTQNKISCLLPVHLIQVKPGQAQKKFDSHLTHSLTSQITKHDLLTRPSPEGSGPVKTWTIQKILTTACRSRRIFFIVAKKSEGSDEVEDDDTAESSEVEAALDCSPELFASISCLTFSTRRVLAFSKLAVFQNKSPLYLGKITQFTSRNRTNRLLQNKDDH
jgi:hypothetical protein